MLRKNYEALEQVAREVMDSSSQGVFKLKLDRALRPGLVEGVPACVRGLELDDLHGPFQLSPFCDSRSDFSLVTSHHKKICAVLVPGILVSRVFFWLNIRYILW